MGMSIDLNKEVIKHIKNDNLFEQLKDNLVKKSIIEAVKNGKAWTDSDSYICDDDHGIDEYSMEMPIIQSCESFFYNPKNKE
jgi:hypothetical protein